MKGKQSYQPPKTIGSSTASTYKEILKNIEKNFENFNAQDIENLKAFANLTSFEQTILIVRETPFGKW